MKKEIVLLLFLLSGFCITAIAKKVEINEAKVVGKNFFYQRINLHQNITYGSLAIVREYTEKKNGIPLYYIFNFNSKGYIIIAADDAVYPVLGYSFETSYPTENPSPEFTFWMEHYREQIWDEIERKLPAESEIIETWAQLSKAEDPHLLHPESILDVQPLITDIWNQDFPYNEMCPEDPAGPTGHVYVGCVATAMAMIMDYWRSPMMGQGYHCDTPQPSYGPQCANFGITTYDWNGTTSAPSEECDPVALLSWQCGIAVDMDYGPTGSYAQYYKVSDALINYFKYDTNIRYLQKYSYSTSDWNNLLKGDLDAGRPIEYGGTGPEGGHAWICDGYQGTDFFHMNWGWGGSGNGYYYLNNLNPDGNTFNNAQNATVHIQPDPAYYPAYCAGETMDTTYAFGSIEDGSGPVSNYMNNADCSWLIGPDDSVQSIKLTFLRFATDPSDLIKVYDGPTTSSTLLGTYSGSLLPPEINSTGNKMLVTFTSNSNTTAPGFLADYHCTLNFYCSGTTILTDPSADFGDGSGRFRYRNTSTCKWKIMPADAASVTLTFNNFKTEQNKDIVQVFDIGSNTLLAAYSGNYSTPPAPVTAPSGKMSVLFNTNNEVRDAGWDASYSITVGTNTLNVAQEMKIYPNPVNKLITIELPGLSGDPSGSVSISGTTGQKFIHHEVQSAKVEIDVSSLPKGLYFVRLINNEMIEVGKFIKE